MNEMIWDFWANKYHRLWVQKHSLGPTRRVVMELLSELGITRATKLIDLGCGPGELIEELGRGYGKIEATGIDYSREMLKISAERNPWARHIHLKAEELGDINEIFDILVCTHSLPYYKNKLGIVRELHRLLKPGGRLIMAFASGNSAYDRFILSFVKLTTGRAEYPSHEEFLRLVKPCFEFEKHLVIRERFYMPTISVYQLRRIDH
jgi:ubiquinone/menaquinone biosynthesis C-methylase UbiE